MVYDLTLSYPKDICHLQRAHVMAEGKNNINNINNNNNNNNNNK